MTGYTLLNTLRKKVSSQAIFNESSEIKKSKQIGKPGQVGTCKLILYFTKTRYLFDNWINKLLAHIVSTYKSTDRDH